jgi:hypothetical protein
LHVGEVTRPFVEEGPNLTTNKDDRISVQKEKETNSATPGNSARQTACWCDRRHRNPYNKNLAGKSDKS